MPIKVSINVSLILKEHLFQGKKGKYLNLVLFETPNDQYENDYRVSQDLPKEARDAGEKGPILGNGKNFGKSAPKTEQRPPQKVKPPADPDLDAESSDIPF